jgi:hypothetical protein
MKQSWKFGMMIGLASVCLMAQPPGPPPHAGGWGGPGSRFAFMPFGPGPGATITGAPYSAVQITETTQKLADGNTISERHQSNVYRDAQGRVRVEHTLPARAGSTTQGTRTVISIFDPVAGASYMLQPNTTTAYKSNLHTRPAADASTGNHPQRPGRRGPANPPQTENLGLQTINGVAATGTRVTQTIPAGAIGNAQAIQSVREVWISQDLKIPVLIKNSDPRFGESVMQLSNIMQTNPDASLFQVPAGYTVENAPGRAAGMGRGRVQGNGPGRQ